MNTDKNLYTIKAAANKLDVTKSIIYHIIAKHKIKTYKNHQGSKNAKVDIYQIIPLIEERRFYTRQDIHTKLNSMPIIAASVYEVNTICSDYKIKRKLFISFIERWGGVFIKERRDSQGGLERTKISGFELMIVLSKYHFNFHNKS